MRHTAWMPLLVACSLLLGCPAPDGEPEGGSGKGDGTGVSTAEEDEAPPIAQDVSKVRIGQVYRWRVDEPFKKESTWTITKIVKNREIHYDLVSVTHVEMEGMEDAPPTREGPTAQVAPLPPREPTGTLTDKTVTVMVDGESFPCVVYTTEDEETIWYSDKFPFWIKREKGGRSLGKLVGISTPAAPPAKTAAKTAEPAKTAKTP